MQARGRILFLGVVVVAAATVAWSSLHGDRGAEAALSAWVPKDARAVVWIDDLGELLAQLERLGGRLEGAGGIPEALALAVGVEHPTPAAVEAAGLRAAAGGAVFVWRDAAWACVAVHPKRGIPHIRVWLEQRGFDLIAAARPDTWHVRVPITARTVATLWRRGSTVIARAPLPQSWRAVLGRPADQHADGAKTTNSEAINGGEKAATADDPATALQALEASETGLPAAGATGVHLRAQLGRGDAVRPALRSALGLGSLLFGGLVDAVQGLQADLNVAGRAVKLALRLPSAPKANSEIARYHDGFLPKGSAPLDLGATLPDEVALWARAHLNPRQLDMIPGFLLDRMLPENLLRALHPALAAVNARTLLIDRLEGRFAVGALGLDDKAPLDPRRWRRLGVQRLIGGFVAATLQKPQHAVAFMAAVHDALVAGGVQLAPLTLGAWRGWTGVVRGAEVSLVRRTNALLLISGNGELARFQRVVRGKFPSLAKVAGTPLERAMAADTIGWIGVGSTTGRIARAARRRGVPDAFVRMVRGVAALTAGIRLDADGIAADIALRPRAEAKP